MQSTILLWLPVASGTFYDLPQGNKLGSHVGKEKHQRTNDSISSIKMWIKIWELESVSRSRNFKVDLNLAVINWI